MDDLSGLDWSQSAKPSPTPVAAATANYTSTYASFRPPPPSSTPSPAPVGSARSTPFSGFSGLSAGATKPSTTGQSSASGVPAKPAHDSFSNLVNFGPAKRTANLSLRERQDLLDAEHRRREAEQRRQHESQFGNGQFLDALGSGAGSRTVSRTPSPAGAAGSGNDDDSLFAAFRAETKVDKASHYPPPATTVSPPTVMAATPPQALDLTSPAAWQQPSASGGAFEDVDDPFGLNQLKPKGAATATSTTPAPTSTGDDEDDDLLGDLGRPVAEVQRKTQRPTPTPGPGKPIEDSSSSSSSSSSSPDDEVPPAPTRRSADPFDKAVAQLVDYGFSPEDARRGLTESGAGINVQAAANWLLDDAHKRAKEKAKGGRSQSRDAERSRGQVRECGDEPAWMWESSRDSRQRTDRSPAGLDGDLSRTAAAMGSSLFKTANSLWKSGQKRMQQAMAELQEPDDPSQPKWMRAAQQQQQPKPGRPRPQQMDVTDEAMMLESGGWPERQVRADRSGRSDGPALPDRPTLPDRTRKPAPDMRSRDQSPALSAQSAQSSGRSTPRWQQQPAFDSRARLSRLAKEDDDLPVYVSANRRRTPQPQSKPVPKPSPDGDHSDLLFGTSNMKPKPSASAPALVSSRPTPPPPRPAAPTAPKRTIPELSPAVLAASNKHRLAGTAHFKRGDYASAHESYTASMQGIPSMHPLAIVLLTNRALTHLKTGSPKLAVEDADAALGVIGPSNGVGETVSVAGESGALETRDMRDLFGKALSRKAEALEQMERWADAGAVWQLCVEANVNGASAVQGRQRCQSALAPKPNKPTPRPTPRPTPTPSRPKLPTSSSSSSSSSAAVSRLRQANEAAAREDDERFALADQVDARVAAWRDGKTENLRALLASLDQVLWEGSGWNKVSLADLVVASRVKVVYMKAIAKTHPDKLAQDASTEVKLVAATVFSTLNTAWDKFKADNKL